VADSFPRQFARTQRLTLGEPRNVNVSPDGKRVVFLRSTGGSDQVNALWVLDVDNGMERLVADPRTLLSDDDDTELPAEEQARRERAREGAGGITAYATDRECTVVAFALAGRLFAGGLVSGRARELSVDGPVFDPRPDPTARRIAYVSGRGLRIAELDGTWRSVAGGDDTEPDTVSWGSADFIAAEEMGRFRGYWWSPDGTMLAVCRVDDAAVSTWVIADPAHPDRPARTIRYPAAGTANPEVSLHLVGLDGSRVAVDWDRDFFPYLAAVTWTEAGLTLLVQARDQQGSMVLQVDTRDTPTRGETTVLSHDYDDAWVELVPGTPARLDDGRLVMTADRDGSRRLLIADEPVTPTDMQVRSVVAAIGEDDDATVTFCANPIDDATQLHVWQWTGDGLQPLTSEPGVHGAAIGATTSVIRSATLDHPGTRTIVRSAAGDHEIASFAETPLVEPNVQLLRVGDSELAAAVLLPRDVDPDHGPLPVLLDPYGGPHALRVTRSHNAYLASQWFADQGFAVIVTDGRGTPGRGSDWERAVHGDFAGPTLDDQVEALHAVAEQVPGLDLDRVAIRGWSFGGYLAALAVLRRPEVFHAAIAGAPVTEWRLYDTHYTERYLGDPADRPDHYDANSLLPLAGDLTRPLLLIHGLADDNVVAAHTLQLSAALLEAGRPHEVLPLAGITHMTPQEEVAENLLLHQLDFLRRALPPTNFAPLTPKDPS
jgi:dipeptidyl-peptidase-4